MQHVCMNGPTICVDSEVSTSVRDIPVGRVHIYLIVRILTE